jgi:peptidoglycan hydrolase CwlO-like protein
LNLNIICKSNENLLKDDESDQDHAIDYNKNNFNDDNDSVEAELAEVETRLVQIERQMRALETEQRALFAKRQTCLDRISSGDDCPGNAASSIQSNEQWTSTG